MGALHSITSEYRRLLLTPNYFGSSVAFITPATMLHYSKTKAANPVMTAAPTAARPYLFHMLRSDQNLSGFMVHLFRLETLRSHCQAGQSRSRIPQG